MVQLYVNIAKHAIEKYGTTIVTSWDWGIWVTMGITVIMYTHVLYVCIYIYTMTMRILLDNIGMLLLGYDM